MKYRYLQLVSLCFTAQLFAAGGSIGTGPTISANTTVTSSSIAAAGGVTNGSSALFSQVIVSNSTYGKVTINGPQDAGANSIDTYQGNFRFFPATGKGFQVLRPDGASFMAADGVTRSTSFGNNFQDIFSGGTMNWLMSYDWGSPNVLTPHGFSDIPISGYQFYNGGSASTLDDLPADSKELGLTLPVPPIVLTSYSTYALGVGYIKELYCSNLMNQCVTNGLVAAITNAGIPMWFHMDDQVKYFNQTRDNSAYRLLSINTANFPSGTNFSTVCSNMGFGLQGTLYLWNYPTNIYSIYGGTTNSQPAMSPDTVMQDIGKCYDFGWTAIRLADINQTVGGFSLFTRKISESVLNPWATWSTRKNTYGSDANNGGRGLFKPMAIEMLFTDIGITPTFAFRQVNIVGHDNTAQQWPGQITNATTYVRCMNRFRGVYNFESPFTEPGHYPQAAPTESFFNGDLTLDYCRLALSATVVSSGNLNFGFIGTNAMRLQLTNFLGNVTNATFLRIWADQNTIRRPWMLFDNGATNTSGYYRQLTGGEVALMLANETGSSSNITANLSALGPANTVWEIISTWDNQSSLGFYSGSYTYTNTPSGGCALLLLKPRGTTGFKQIETLTMTTNFAATNVISTPFCATLTNNGNYVIKVLANVSGLSASDKPDMWCFVTNATARGYETSFNPTVKLQTIGLEYGYDEISAGGYPYPLSSTGSGFAVNGLSYNRLGTVANSGAANGQNPSFTLEQRVTVTNAPVTINYTFINNNGATTTNTLQKYSFISITQQ